VKALSYIADFMLGFLFGSRRRNRQTDLFRRKIVITVRWWEIIILLICIVPAVLFRLGPVTNVVCLAITFGVVFSGYRMRQSVQDLRYQVHKLLTNIENDELDEDPDFIEATERIPVKAINGKRNARVSEHK
jgi:hypothetical protein